MKITLISLHSDITAVGIRYLASRLKEEGHHPRIIFLPDPGEENRPPAQALVRAIAECAAGSGLIGISLLSCHYRRAVSLTRSLKKQLSLPLLWGGIEPTIRAGECLQAADWICRGEGEEMVAELAEKLAAGSPCRHVPNLGYMDGDRVVLNPVRPLIQDLDALPFPDYDLDHHFIGLDNSLERLDKEKLHFHMCRAPITGLDQKIYYQMMASRGCPHKCSYCCNDYYRALYPDCSYLRRRSPSRIVAEITDIRKRFPYIEAVAFSDDSFMIAGDDEMEQFSTLYREKVNLPFRCLVSPHTVSEKKIALLVACGLSSVQMGIESGSDRILALFNRAGGRKKILETAHILNRFKEKMSPPIYDFIIENPFEEREDIRESLDLIASLPRPYRIQVFPLKIFPGTKLFTDSLKTVPRETLEKEIYQEKWQPYRRNLVNLLYVLPNTRFPLFLWKIMKTRMFLDLLDNKLVNYLLNRTYRLLKGET